MEALVFQKKKNCVMGMSNFIYLVLTEHIKDGP